MMSRRLLTFLVVPFIGEMAEDANAQFRLHFSAVSPLNVCAPDYPKFREFSYRFRIELEGVCDSVDPAVGESPSTTTFRVTRVFGVDAGYKAPTIVTVTRENRFSVGEKALLIGSGGVERITFRAVPWTEERRNYLTDYPGDDVTFATLLKHSLKFLGSQDSWVHRAAVYDIEQKFSFALSSRQKRECWTDLGTLIDEIPVDQLRRRFNTYEYAGVTYDRSLCAFLLGFAAVDQRDTDLFLESIRDSRKGEYSWDPGLEGIMTGYLLLAGEQGLERIENQLRTLPTGKWVRWEWNTYYNAISLLLLIDDRTIREQSLRAALYRGLNDSPRAWLVIAELEELRDWSQLDRVVRLDLEFSDEEEHVHRAILSYVAASVWAGENTPSKPQYLPQAKKHLEVLKRRHPALSATPLRYPF